MQGCVYVVHVKTNFRYVELTVFIVLIFFFLPDRLYNCISADYELAVIVVKQFAKSDD